MCLILVFKLKIWTLMIDEITFVERSDAMDSKVKAKQERIEEEELTRY